MTIVRVPLPASLEPRMRAATAACTRWPMVRRYLQPIQVLCGFGRLATALREVTSGTSTSSSWSRGPGRLRRGSHCRTERLGLASFGCSCAGHRSTRASATCRRAEHLRLPTPQGGGAPQPTALCLTVALREIACSYLASSCGPNRWHVHPSMYQGGKGIPGQAQDRSTSARMTAYALFKLGQSSGRAYVVIGARTLPCPCQCLYM